MSAYLIYPPSSGSGGAAKILDADLVSLSSGLLSTTVLLSSTLADTNYAVFCTIENSLDGSPEFLQFYIANKTTSSFDITFNAPTDTANYILNYLVTGIV